MRVSVATLRARLISVAAVLLATGQLVAPTPSIAATVDQQNWPTGAPSGGFYQLDIPFSAPGRLPTIVFAVAQTFTAGSTGNLSGVTLDLSANCATMSCPSQVHVQIRSVDSYAEPSSTVLAEANLAQSQLETGDSNVPAKHVQVTFDAPAAVTAGTQYALVISALPLPQRDLDQSAVYVGADGSGGYAGGQVWLSQSLVQSNPPTTPWSPQTSVDLYFTTILS